MDTADLPNAPLVHGGDLAAASKRYGVPRDAWLDLSTGINQNAYPVPEIAGEHWARLPDRDLTDGVVSAARAAYGVPSAADVAAAAGTQALIQVLPRLRPPGCVAVVSPTYEEHAECWRRCGHDVANIAADQAWPNTADVVVMVRPNNPDGHVADAESVLAQLDGLAGRGGWLVLDEAFADATPRLSLARFADRPGVIVLRSFGKFFGLAGLRLGFALTNGPMAAHLRAELGPWSVSGPALEIARRALSDQDWIVATRLQLARNADRMDQFLDRAGLEIVGGTPLFRLVNDGGRGTHEHLARQGIWTRSFPSQPGLVRFGVPGGDSEFERLARSLAVKEA